MRLKEAPYVQVAAEHGGPGETGADFAKILLLRTLRQGSSLPEISSYTCILGNI